MSQAVNPITVTRRGSSLQAHRGDDLVGLIVWDPKPGHVEVMHLSSEEPRALALMMIKMRRELAPIEVRYECQPDNEQMARLTRLMGARAVFHFNLPIAGDGRPSFSSPDGDLK